MNKAKIILLSMLVLAAVGGVVAFKANAFEAKRLTRICYSSTVNGTCLFPYSCKNMWTVRTTIGVVPVCYTLYIEGIPCTSSIMSCSVVTAVTIE
jgi:hypothetical protein